MMTTEVLIVIENVFNKTNLIEACTKERANTEWQFNKITKLTVFGAELEENPVRYKTEILPEPLTKTTL